MHLQRTSSKFCNIKDNKKRVLNPGSGLHVNLISLFQAAPDSGD